MPLPLRKSGGAAAITLLTGDGGLGTGYGLFVVGAGAFPSNEGAVGFQELLALCVVDLLILVLIEVAHAIARRAKGAQAAQVIGKPYVVTFIEPSATIRTHDRFATDVFKGLFAAGRFDVEDVVTVLEAVRFGCVVAIQRGLAIRNALGVVTRVNLDFQVVEPLLSRWRIRIAGAQAQYDNERGKLARIQSGTVAQQPYSKPQLEFV